MAVLAITHLPPELLLRIVSFAKRETVVDADNCLGPWTSDVYQQPQVELVPDLPTINALSQTNTFLCRLLHQTLYSLCASVEPLGRLALLYAVRHELGNTVDKLVAAGIHLDGEFNFEDIQGSILHIAAALGLSSMVSKLLGIYGEEMTTRVHARSLSFNKTPLDLAAYYGHMDVVRLLARVSPTVGPSVLVERTRYLNTALLEAAYCGNLERSRILISEGAEANCHDDNFPHGPPLTGAAFAKNLELVQFLLASGSDPNLYNHGAFVPLYAAVRSKNMAIVYALVNAGANIHVQDSRRGNVLSHCETVESLRYFLERGVDPNREDHAGSTLLHDICAKHTREAQAFVELLCQFGAAPDRENRDGETAVYLAMSAGWPERVKIMEPFVQDPEQRARIAKWLEEENQANI
ncbi:ankyrin repeat-containing domain protein [Mycena sanguinolenta]|nr:ankyrin repeat-containing domain protein [Mycena sanguinolenta]